MKQFRAVIEYEDGQIFYHHQIARSIGEAIAFIHAKFKYSYIKILEIDELKNVEEEHNSTIETYYGGRNDND